MEKVHQKLDLDAFLILANKPKQPLHTKIKKKKIFNFVGGLSKSLKKVNFIFSFEPSPF